MEYYSDQINGAQPRDVEIIPPNVWGGIVSIVNGLVASGAFGKCFPEECPDGQGVYATNEKLLNYRCALKFLILSILLLLKKRLVKVIFLRKNHTHLITFQY